MHFHTSLFLSVLPALTFSLPLQPRQLFPTGQTVKQDVINIHNAVYVLDAAVQSFTGAPFPTSLVDGKQVLAGVAEIHKVNRVGFQHASTALPFSVKDSIDVINTVVSTVGVSIPASTKGLKAKADVFKKSGLQGVVLASLNLLLYDHDSFSAATLLKTNLGIGEAKIKQGAEAVANIHNAIQDAITFYSGV